MFKVFSDHPRSFVNRADFSHLTKFSCTHNVWCVLYFTFRCIEDDDRFGVKHDLLLYIFHPLKCSNAGLNYPSIQLAADVELRCDRTADSSRLWGYFSTQFFCVYVNSSETYKIPSFRLSGRYFYCLKSLHSAAKSLALVRPLNSKSLFTPREFFVSIRFCNSLASARTTNGRGTDTKNLNSRHTRSLPQRVIRFGENDDASLLRAIKKFEFDFHPIFTWPVVKSLADSTRATLIHEQLLSNVK